MVKYFPCDYGFILHERWWHLHNLQMLLKQKTHQAEFSWHVIAPSVFYSLLTVWCWACSPPAEPIAIHQTFILGRTNFLFFKDLSSKCYRAWVRKSIYISEQSLLAHNYCHYNHSYSTRTWPQPQIRRGQRAWRSYILLAWGYFSFYKLLHFKTFRL